MTTRGSYPRSVLVDSGAWLALSDNRDDNHRPAIAIQRDLRLQRPRLFVTNFLIDETYTLIRARMNYQLAAYAGERFPPNPRWLIARYPIYDGSKNHSAAWCDMRVCGNWAKLRAYQSRRRTAVR